MQIDWFTCAAQIVNFLVLVALLRWLLYGPIVRAMHKREEQIARRLNEAGKEREVAEARVQEYEEKSRRIEQQREELLKEARHQAEAEHRRLLKQSREEVDRKREQWEEAYRQEQEDLIWELRCQAGRMGVEAARRTLSQLADADLEQRVCDAFASRLQQLDDQQRQQISRHCGNGKAVVSIRSAFQMPDERRKRLSEMIHETFGTDADVSFEQSPDLICGVELNVGGYSFGWNVEEYLHDLATDFIERLRSKQ